VSTSSRTPRGARTAPSSRVHRVRESAPGCSDVDGSAGQPPMDRRSTGGDAGSVPGAIRLLGPVELHGKHGPVTLGGAKERTPLAVLALHAGAVVPDAALVDALQGDRTIRVLSPSCLGAPARRSLPGRRQGQDPHRDARLAQPFGAAFVAMQPAQIRRQPRAACHGAGSCGSPRAVGSATRARPVSASPSTRLLRPGPSSAGFPGRWSSGSPPGRTPARRPWGAHPAPAQRLATRANAGRACRWPWPRG